MNDDNAQPISGAYTSPDSKFNYVETDGTTEILNGTGLWFFNSGSSRGQ